MRYVILITMPDGVPVHEPDIIEYDPKKAVIAWLRMGYKSVLQN